MREIKNNVEIGKIQQKHEIKTGKAEETFPQISAAEETPSKEVSFSGAEVLGRSQVNKADALNKDIAFGMKHPDAIEKADKFFKVAYSKLKADGEANAYEKACTLTNAYVKELEI